MTTSQAIGAVLRAYYDQKPLPEPAVTVLGVHLGVLSVNATVDDADERWNDIIDAMEKQIEEWRNK